VQSHRGTATPEFGVTRKTARRRPIETISNRAQPCRIMLKVSAYTARGLPRLIV
jgi:hypothetical protein